LEAEEQVPFHWLETPTGETDNNNNINSVRGNVNKQLKMSFDGTGWNWYVMPSLSSQRLILILLQQVRRVPHR
jgi:hypothetical protein